MENTNIEEFNKDIKVICDLYENAQDLYKEGIHLISTDEKTGIQALERRYPDLPVKKNLIKRQEFEYIRHGTQCLIANFDVATGRMITPTIGSTRNEEDFVKHISQTISIDTKGEWIFIVDQLNTHQSESLVKLVENECLIKEDLGIKGKAGILQSKESRAEFLKKPEHRIRFVYTPKHTSWMNQVEIWFGILVRRLLKWSSFKSIDELREKILSFIDYFNETMSKPFDWKYKGPSLKPDKRPKILSLQDKFKKFYVFKPELLLAS